MRTPKDIKKAMACDCDGPDCENCAYVETINDEKFCEMLRFHCSEIYKDALEYIQRLESSLAQVAMGRDAAVIAILNAQHYIKDLGAVNYGLQQLEKWDYSIKQLGVCDENTKDD